MLNKNQSRSLFVFSIFITLALIVLIQQFVQTSVAAAVNAPLFSDVPAPNRPSQPDDTALRSRYVTVNFDKLHYLNRSPQPYLELPLFNDVVITAEYKQTNQFENGAFVWVGHDPNTPYTDVQLSVNQGILVGTINVYNELYRISYAGEGIHRIEQLPLDTWQGLEPLIPADSQTQSAQTDTTAPTNTQTDDGSVIDAMVLYTPAVVDAEGSIEAAEGLINLAISETNTGYDDSGINFDLRLVHTELVDYQEVEAPNNTSAIAFTSALDAVTYTNDGQIDHIHALRDTHHADVVILMIDGQNYCGVAWLMSTERASFESSAFSVVQYSCATGYYSFGHEIGHNMGSNHDRANASNGAFPYSFGYQDPSGQFRTIMAYRNGCAGSCPRVNRWSNPAATYNGLPTGVDPNAGNSASNALSLNNTADTVANFRVVPTETTPTPSPTATSTATPSPTPTHTPEPTLTPTPSPTPIPTTQISVPVDGGIFQSGYLGIYIPEGMFDETVLLEFEPIPAASLATTNIRADQSFTRDYQFRLHAIYASTGLPAEPRAGMNYDIAIFYEDTPQTLNLVNESTIDLYYWNAATNQWELESPTMVNTSADIITANVEYFGIWAVMGEAPTKNYIPFTVKQP